jgi:hypothetical protein
VTIPRLAILVLLVGVALVGLYVWFVLAWSYSDGERAGILQKFSRKGWICKTHEGELMITPGPGMVPIIWDFSVRDERVIPHLDAALGKRVVLHYTEHRGIPTNCFGDTPFFVNRVRPAE